MVSVPWPRSTAVREGELLLMLGDARQRAGDPERARSAFEEAAAGARARADGDLLARAALGAGGLSLVLRAADEGLVALLREALAGIGEEPSALRARLLGRLGVEIVYADPDEAGVLSSEALALARGLGEPAALAAALTAWHAANWAPDRIEGRLAVADEIVALARAAGDREAELHGRNWRVLDLLELGRVDETRAEVDAFSRAADALGLPHHRWYVPLWRSTLAALEGRFDEATSLSSQTLALGEEAQDPNARLFHQVADDDRALPAPALRGDRPRACLQDVRSFTGRRYTWGWLVCAWLVETGRAEEARELFEDLAADDSPTCRPG